MLFYRDLGPLSMAKVLDILLSHIISNNISKPQIRLLKHFLGPGDTSEGKILIIDTVGISKETRHH